MLSKEEINEIKRQLTYELLPIGVILIFPYECAPDGFIPCDGRSLNKREFQNLYELIGDIFGADATTFRIPDLRGKFVRGYDDSGIYDCEHKFGEYQMDAIQGHSHKADWKERETKCSGEHYHSYYAEPYDARTYHSEYSHVHGNDGDPSGPNFLRSTNSCGGHSHELPDIHFSEMISSNQGPIRSATETRPKNLALNFCIKVK